MESGILRILLKRPARAAAMLAQTAVLLCAVCGAGIAAAQNNSQNNPQNSDDIVGGDPVFTPETERRAISEAKIDARDIEFGVYAGFLSIEDFGSDAVFGASIGYHITEDFFVEALVGMSEAGKTSFELLAGDVALLTDDERNFRYYNISLGYQLLPGESFIGGKRAFNSGMYVAGGVGATEFAGDRRLTWNVGVGYRLLLKDWLALRIDIRDHLFDIDVIGEDKTTHNIAVTGGLTVFF